MSSTRRRVFASLVAGAALALAGCGQSPSGPSSEPLRDASSAVNTTEVSDRITFVRTTANLNDAVRYRGKLAVGDERCLYVVIEGKTYLAAVGVLTQVDGAGVRASDGNHAYGVETTFGRLATSVVVPAQSTAQCKDATELFALGF